MSGIEAVFNLKHNGNCICSMRLEQNTFDPLHINGAELKTAQRIQNNMKCIIS